MSSGKTISLDALCRGVSILGLSMGIMAATAASSAAQSSSEAQMGQALMEMQNSDGVGAPPAAGWFTCDVDKAGAGWAVNIYVMLSCDGGISGLWFVARQDQEKEMLATALTAISTNKKVQVYLSDSTAYSEILACYIQR